MTNRPLRYQEIEPDRRSELRLLDKTTLIEKILEYESQVLFDPQVLVDETTSLVRYLETRRRVIDYVETSFPDAEPALRRHLARNLLLIVTAVTEQET